MFEIIGDLVYLALENPIKTVLLMGIIIVIKHNLNTGRSTIIHQVETWQGARKAKNASIEHNNEIVTHQSAQKDDAGAYDGTITKNPTGTRFFYGIWDTDKTKNEDE